MMETSGVRSNAGAMMNMLVKNADQDVAKTAYLLKKTMKMEMDVVNKLLPMPQGGVDILA